MTICISETLIALTDVPDKLPRRRGKKISYSTVYRWAQRGVRGKRLEVVRIGGVLYTSIEATSRFFCEDSPSKPSESRIDAVMSAERELDAEE